MQSCRVPVSLLHRRQSRHAKFGLVPPVQQGSQHEDIRGIAFINVIRTRAEEALIVNPRLAEMWSFTPAVSQMPRRALSAPGGAVIDVTKE
jgi:hypothetical protein